QGPARGAGQAGDREGLVGPPVGPAAEESGGAVHGCGAESGRVRDESYRSHTSYGSYGTYATEARNHRMSIESLPRETAPSALTEDQASFARTVGLTGLMAVSLGVLILILNAAQARLPFDLGNNVGFAGILVGMAMMFFHATRDTDQLMRRLYGYVGGIGLPLSGVILSLLPVLISAAKSPPEEGPKPIVSLFFPFGWACFLAGLFFLIPFCRNESDETHRRYGLWALGGIGAGLALVGLVGGLTMEGFALTYGSVLALLGLGYLCAFIGQLGGAGPGGCRPRSLFGVRRGV